MNTENKELSLLPARETAVQVFSTMNGLDPYLFQIRSEIDAFVPDVSTKKGRDSIASMAYKIAKSKTALDGMGKELVAELKQIPALIDAERKRVREILDAWRDEVRKQLDDWQADQKAIKEKRLADEAEAERLRLAEIAARELQEQIDRDHELAVFMYAEYLRQKEESAKQAIINAENEAKAQKEREQQIAHEAAENARIEAERAAAYEQQRIKDEAARQAAEAQSAIDRANHLKAESEAREIAQKQAAELATKQAAEKAERDRLQAIADTEARIAREKLQEQAEAELREKNKAHAKRINNEILEDFIAAGLSEELAKIAITAIAKGQVRNTKINY